MPSTLHPHFPSIAPSRRRSLVRDVCGCLRQQMFFWGCDASHLGGNFLIRYGMNRLGRAETHSEGSSRYRMGWRDGTVELHSFCAGWYPSAGNGVVFIRNREYLSSFAGGEPLTPGVYDSARCTDSTIDDMLENCRPLLEWVSDYENWIHSQTGSEYRHKCWRMLQSRAGGRPWLTPSDAQNWMNRFLDDPGSTPRARDFLRKQA